MPLLRAVARAVRAGSLENPALPLTSTTLAEMLAVGTKAEAGVTVTETSALGLGPVYRAVSLISGLGGALPLHCYVRGTRDRADNALLDDPHPDLTPLELWRLTYVHRLLWGNAYLQKVYAGSGEVRYLLPIRPQRVKVGRGAPSAANPGGKMFEVVADDGSRVGYTSREILHLPGLSYDGVVGVSPVQLARQAIGLGLAAERYGARLFGSGALVSGILQTDQRLTQEQADELRAKWRDKTAGLDRAHDVPVLDTGATFHQLTMPNDDAQFLESRHFQVADVARFFGVPPFLLMETEKSTSWGTGLEQQALGFVQFDLSPAWLAPTEQRLTKELLRDRGQYGKYAVEGLLRGDSAARAAFYTAMRNVGAFNVDEIRELEDRPPLPDGQGQGYLQPLNMAPLGTESEGGPDDDPLDDPAGD